MSLTQSKGARNGAKEDRLTGPFSNQAARRSRPLFVPEIRDGLLAGRKSAKWIRNNFDPEHKHYLGREPYWLEDDAYRWLESRPGAV
ncbi:MAG TPA: hypothetical protein VFT41_04910 [Gemmatimonadaceae bacterium]|nr:hypothetical protein [Gemmatimonadaceae bacterium]